MKLNQRNLESFKTVHREYNPEKVYDYLNRGWVLLKIDTEENPPERQQRTIFTFGWNKDHDEGQKSKNPYEELYQKRNYYSKKYLE
ncbi:hypothetical protein [Paenibacillus sp. MBLB4367]|uniref:hypothetical protein n=1 Tax=Paenibacillus sp. MBLB4367 TaxID=3384767 RepID=UPI0039082D40